MVADDRSMGEQGVELEFILDHAASATELPHGFSRLPEQRME
jgi:hypothetical protein